MRKRWPAGLIIGVTALFVAATPASASTVKFEGLAAEAFMVLTSCASTASVGSSCLVVAVEMDFETATGAGTVADFDVTAGRSILGPNWDVESGFQLQSSGTSNGGSFTMDKTSGTMSLTVNLVCASPPCELFGTFTIKGKMTKRAGAPYHYRSEAQDTIAGACREKVQGSEVAVFKPGGKGTVKYGGSTKSMKVWTGGAVPVILGFGGQKLVKTTTISGICNPSPILLGSLDPPETELTGGHFGLGA